ncbi:hypothetical protein GS501_00130 [Saccharibacter sp. 17.LH.SD]|uniref:hypothetical protein n=1 Tax=Saccharibacter sp. 17.LH.SD TaxID=2689393 RepID=UPI00136E6BCC|nr:hypothetical protein [Saccharibacter sp. 17.LH.SD]MXV43488.1 hypothetical protein [Saccharibacter sp. 17.LH.SD]
MPRSISFTLPTPYPLLNKTLRMHHRALTRLKKSLRANIVAAIGGPQNIPSKPFPYAHIRIERWSVGTPDKDNLEGGGAKQLIDCLTTPVIQARRHVRNKYGLGIIVDDSPAHITTEYHAVKCRLCEQKTVVTITEIEGPR